MKKILLSVCALGALTFTSCTSEVDMFETIGTPKATIELNISNDKEMVTTRASQTVSDASNWYITVGDQDQIRVSELASKTYSAGTEYKMVVSKYADINAAMPINEAGNAYYEGTETITLIKGNNAVTIDCGTAKNAKLTTNTTGLSDVDAITEVSINAKQGTEGDKRNYTFSTDGSAFFFADQAINCTISYKYNGISKTINSNITTVDPATEYKLTLAANDKGIITLTITYDDTFAIGENTNITIDAVSGDEVPTPSAE